jgi:hypothetical protein
MINREKVKELFLRGKETPTQYRNGAKNDKWSQIQGIVTSSV